MIEVISKDGKARCTVQIVLIDGSIRQDDARRVMMALLDLEECGVIRFETTSVEESNYGHASCG